METALSLKEKFIILAYHPVKGSNMAQNYLGYGIAGALLLELAVMKRIVIEEKKVKLTDHRKTGDKQLDLVVDMLIKAGKPVRVKALVFKLQGKNKTIRRPVMDGLLRKRYLRAEDKRFLFFRYFMYPSGNLNYRRDLEEQIRRLVLREIPAEDPEITLLTGLAGACRFAPRFFRNRQERKTAAKRIKQIIKDSPVDTAIDETIQAVQAAIMATIAASAVATTAASR